MPRNVEIKARVRNPQELRSRIASLGGPPPTVLEQTDIFYALPKGRLKLRQMPGKPAELIYYERPDAAGPKVSGYRIFRTDVPATPDASADAGARDVPADAGARDVLADAGARDPSWKGPGALHAVLRDALGTCGTVRKRRELVMVGSTRIHLDDVEGLGLFLELEVVLAHDQTPQDGRRIAERLMTDLGVDPDDLIEGAYVDLLNHLGL